MSVRRRYVVQFVGLISITLKGGAKPMSNEQSANRLVMEVSRLRSLRPAPLGPDNQVAYGTLLFKYVPESDKLICAILVTQNGIWRSFGEQRAAAFLRTIHALSEPAIGGMFDTGGGAWSFERETGKAYLYVAFPLTADPAEVNRGIDAMARVVPAWATRWQLAVANIAHGREPPPKQRVTLQNDPYAGKL